MSRLCFFILPLLLSACTAPVVKQTIDDPIAKVRSDTRGIDRLLLEAGGTIPPRSTELRLRAAQLAFSANELALTQRIIDAVQNPYISDETTRRYAFLNAELALSRNEPNIAIKYLEDRRLQNIPLDTKTQVTSGQLRARAYEMGRSYIASARELIYVDRLLPVNARQANHDLIFTTLLRLGADTLQTQAEQSITAEIRGWLSLAAMSKRFQHDPLRQLNALKDWQKVWPNHPAALVIPGSLQMLSRIVANRPENIALILPLNGSLGNIGRAIRDGYIAAHYQLTPDTQLRIYDSTTAEILELVSRAERDGVRLIIGPLDREKVTTIAKQPLSTPVIALNRTLGGEINPNLYQFGLAPEDESLQVAAQINREDRLKGLVIAPDSEWGQRNYNAFADRFAEQGGIIVDSAFFKNQRDYSDIVKSLLNIDSSEKRAANLRRITGERFEFSARRRQDIEFIFLLANPNQARGINPTLGFFYAEDVPVYATSHINAGTDSRINSMDLNGIRFCDIPWRLTQSDTLQNTIIDTWPTASTQLGSFYALGVDVHRLYPRLQQLKEHPEERIFGSTGILSLNQDNVINRTLMWARYHEGQVKSVPMILGGAM